MSRFYRFTASDSSSARPVDLSLSHEDQAEMTGFLQNLVRTPSVSAHEQEVAGLIRQQLQAVGVEDIYTDPVGNVVARLGSGDGPTLLIDTHMDTVQAAEGSWPFDDPHAAVIEDGALYGLGACDTKGSIAAIVYAAKQLVESQVELNGSLILAFVVQEEPCEGAALKALIEQEGIRPDWVVLTEPSNLNIMRGHRGRVMFKVTVEGKSSHASKPDLGRNAITAAARLIFGIDMLAADLPGDPFMGAGTIAVTGIESHSASMNAIPGVCTFYIDRRLTLGETVNRAQAEIEQVIAQEDVQAQVEIVDYETGSYTGYRLQVHEAFNAWALEEDDSLLQALADVARQVTGQSPEIGHWGFSTDGVYSMGEANIPTIGFGPGHPDLVHTCEEHIQLDDVVQAAQVYALLAARLLS